MLLPAAYGVTGAFSFIHFKVLTYTEETPVSGLRTPRAARRRTIFFIIYVLKLKPYEKLALFESSGPDQGSRGAGSRHATFINDLFIVLYLHMMTHLCVVVSDRAVSLCPLRGSARGSRRCRAGGGTPKAVQAAGTRKGS